jgi:cytochrome c oxidase assembly protein subunit 15
MAVPDWPTSFDSYDPFNPWPAWWTITPILAEHGHRLIGALVGFLALLLAVWTWRSDSRPWMRRLGFVALALVIFQGVLGGLRVVFISLDLAVVHALVAQLYFSLLASMILFVSPMWARSADIEPVSDVSALKSSVVATSFLVYIQIFLGALLRHPGVGIDPLFAILHLGFAFLVSAHIIRVWFRIRLTIRGEPDLIRLSGYVFVFLGLQVTLGLIAYFVILDERGIVEPSNVQVIINSAHLIVGAMLFASTVVVSLFTFKRSSVLTLVSEPNSL